MNPNSKPNQSSAPRNRAATKSMPLPAVSTAPAKPAPKAVVIPAEPEIAVKAYELWLAGGKQAGQNEKNWQEAKRQLQKT